MSCLPSVSLFLSCKEGRWLARRVARREPGVGQRGGQIVCGQRAALKFAFKKINLVRSLDQNILLFGFKRKKRCNWHRFKITFREKEAHSWVWLWDSFLKTNEAFFNQFQLWAGGSEQGRGYPLMQGRLGGTREGKGQEPFQMESFSNWAVWRTWRKFLSPSLSLEQELCTDFLLLSHLKRNYCLT